MQTSKTVDRPSLSPWILLPLRLFLGITFIYAGIQKFTDPQFFYPNTAGFIGKQMLAFAHGSPIGGFLLHVVVPNALLFGFMVAYGEIAIGLGVLIGLLLRPAAFFGLLLSLVFFLSVTWRVYPYFYGADIVFVFCWLTLLLNGPLNTGLPSVDEFLALNLLPSASPEPQKRLAGVLDFMLGTSLRRAEEPALLANTATDVLKGSSQRGSQQQRTNQQRTTQQKRLIAAEQRAREVRRSFLQGSLLGGGIVFGLGAIIIAYRSLFSATADTTQPSQDTTSNSGTGSGNTGATTPTVAASQTGSSTAIAQVKDVAVNSSTTFTIPATGDPGLLIHLNNGQFVAYDALCTHAGCQVDYDPTQQLIACPCHGAEFDPAKAAAVVAGPAPTPLTGVAISVDSATGAITLH
jgi:thiosulfate dehydrogenase (quinone) large subunit